MVVVAQLAEHSVVVRVVAGSSPVDHPNKQKNRSIRFCFFVVYLAFHIIYSPFTYIERWGSQSGERGV